MSGPSARDPLWDEFRAALPHGVQLHDTQKAVGDFHAAIRVHGWTVKQLIAECSRDLNVVKPGGVVTFRLDNCARHPPPKTPGGVKVPFCSAECRDNAGWVLDDAGMPARRCPCRTPVEAKT